VTFFCSGATEVSDGDAAALCEKQMLGAVRKSGRGKGQHLLSHKDGYRAATNNILFSGIKYAVLQLIIDIYGLLELNMLCCNY